jgi:hypothetical protein
VTHVTGEEAFDSRQEGSGHAQAEEHEALCRGQEGRRNEEAEDDGEEVDDAQEEHEALCRGQEGGSHQEAQDGGPQEDDGPQDDAQEEHEARGRGQEGGSHQKAQDDQKEGRGFDVADGSFSWSGRGAIAPLPRCRIVAGRAASAERRRASLPAAFAHITTS